MLVVAFLLAVVLLSFVSPKLAASLAWLIVICFLLPLFTFGGGTLLWVVCALVSSGSLWTATAWWGFCAFGGLPLGLLVSWFVLKD